MMTTRADAPTHHAETPLAPRLLVTTQDDRTLLLTGEEGLSVMQMIRDAGIDELPAYCGGGCSCATCHVHVAPNWASRLPAMSDDESALLDGAQDRSTYSRLSCQIPFSTALDGLEVRIAIIE